MARDEGLGGSLCLFHGSLTELPLPLPAQEGGADAAALPQSTALPQSLPPLSSPRVADRRRTEGRSPSPRPSSAAASPGVVVVAGVGAGASAAGAVTPKRLQTKLNDRHIEVVDILISQIKFNDQYEQKIKSNLKMLNVLCRRWSSRVQTSIGHGANQTQKKGKSIACHRTQK